ncbi:hypothetical protein [Microbacterium sp. 22242]|uniref:hypothetical protein n=1 Tax=Microbacterium sp. 22242 TaxID=3453896 RepID=UPI003F83242B
MDRDYEVDTDVLRAMAAGARRAADGFGTTRIVNPTAVGHPGVRATVDQFSTAWTKGLSDRLDDVDDFARRLATTARIFDEGQDAAKAELDAQIWSS